MKIFIGSSNESRNKADEIAGIIESMGYTPKVWYDQFGTSEYTFESLERAIQKVNAAILIFSEDDKTWSRERAFPSVRDNVFIEFGLFCGKLSRENVAFCVYGNPNIPTDIKGLKYIDMNKPASARNEIKEWSKKCHDDIIDLTKIEDTFLFNGPNCLITMPELTKGYGGIPKKYIRVHDITLQCGICNLISRVNDIKISHCKSTESWYGTEIHLGNIANSDYVNRYLGDRFPQFEWWITKENFDKIYNPDDFDDNFYNEIRKYSDDWEGYKFNGREYENRHGKQDWAFLLRMNKENFPAEKAKTVHVLFGVGAIGRVGAVNYLLNNYETICDKWGSKDYLLAGKVNKDGVPIGNDAFLENHLL